MKFYKVRGCDSLGDYDIERVKKQLPEIEWFVYNYRDFGYDGSGMALWKKGEQYGYTYMGHCSCNGPLEDLDSIYYSWEEISRLANNDKNWDWTEYGKDVFKKAEKLRTK